MLLHDSRRETRLDAVGELVLLDEQIASDGIRQKFGGNGGLDEAMALFDPGPYQVQAAISALHAEAKTAEETDWLQIAILYNTLAQMVPSVVVKVNRAVAVAMAQGANEGLNLLLRLADEADSFYPYHAARADLLRRTNQLEAAADAYERAITLCPNTAERTYLQRRLDEIQ